MAGVIGGPIGGMDPCGVAAGLALAPTCVPAAPALPLPPLPAIGVGTVTSCAIAATEAVAAAAAFAAASASAGVDGEAVVGVVDPAATGADPVTSAGFAGGRPIGGIVNVPSPLLLDGSPSVLTSGGGAVRLVAAGEGERAAKSSRFSPPTASATAFAAAAAAFAALAAAAPAPCPNALAAGLANGGAVIGAGARPAIGTVVVVCPVAACAAICPVVPAPGTGGGAVAPARLGGAGGIEAVTPARLLGGSGGNLRPHALHWASSSPFSALQNGQLRMRSTACRRGAPYDTRPASSRLKPRE